MGTWGTGSYENDQALNFLQDLIETDDLSFLEECLEIKNLNDYIDVYISTNFIASCKIIAAMHGKPSEKLPANANNWIKNHLQLNSDHLFDNCKNGLSLIIENSEIKDLWKESDSYDEWLKEINNLKNRINSL